MGVGGGCRRQGSRMRGAYTSPLRKSSHPLLTTQGEEVPRELFSVDFELSLRKGQLVYREETSLWETQGYQALVPWPCLSEGHICILYSLPHKAVSNPGRALEKMSLFPLSPDL